MPLRRISFVKRPPLVRYVIGTAIYLVALALRFLTLPVDAHAGFVTFYPAMRTG